MSGEIPRGSIRSTKSPQDRCVNRRLPMTIRLSPRLPSWVCACLAALVPGGGWGGLCAETTKSAAALQSVVISLPDSPGFRFAGYYAAQSKGYFRDAGLDVRLEPARPGTSTVSDVVSGRSNYGVAGSDALLERLNGKPVVLVTTVFQHSALGLAVAGNSTVQTPGELAGRRVAIGALPRDVELWAMLLQEGVRSDSIDVVRNFESANEVEDGEADAMAVYFANHPQLQLGKGDYRILQPATYGVDFYGDSLIASEAELRENPDRVEQLRAAVKRGWEFALQNPESAVENILAGVPDLSPGQTRQRLAEEALAVRELVVPGLVEIGHVNKERWEEMGRLFVTLGLAKDAKRLEGFVYEPAEKFNVTGAVIRWVLIGLVLLGVIGGGIVIWNIRLQRLVEQHTAAYRRSENRFREVFQNLPVATVELDFTSVLQRLHQCKDSGVQDLAAHFNDNEGLVGECMALVRVTGCNERALKFMGVPDVGALARAFPAPDSPGLRSAMRRVFESIWVNRRSVSCDLELTNAQGVNRQSLMQWTVIVSPDGHPDWARTVATLADLTEQRQTEARLRQSEDRWELAVRGLNVGLWEYDFETDRAFFSDRWKEMLGFSPDELTASREEFWSRLHPEDRDRALAAMRAHVEHVVPYYNAEVRVRCKDGSYLWVMSRGQALFDDDGRPRRIVGAHTDISEQKEAEQALRESEARYRLLFESNPSPMWLYDLVTLRFLEVNTAAQKTYGYSRTEFLQMSIMDIRPPDEQERLRVALEGGLGEINIERLAGIWRHLRKDGSTLYMSINLHRYEFSQTPAIVVLAQDVTERHLTEERLRVSEARFRTLFESAVEGVYECTADGTYRAVNPAFARMLGHASPAEMIETVGNGRGVYRLRGRRREFLEALGSSDVVADFQSEAVCADGSTKWISENVRAVRDGQGELLYLQGFVSDITERRRAESALRASEERYRVLFEHSPVAIVEYDYRSVGIWLNDLRASGVEDLEKYMAENPAALSNSLHQIVPAGMNEAVVKLVGGRSKQEVAERFDWIFAEDGYLARQRAFVAIWKGINQIEGEFTLRAVDGTPRLVYYRWWLPVRGGKLDFEWTQLMLVDLTGTKRAEAALATERERLSVTLRAMAEGVVTADTHGIVQFINHAAEELVGWKFGSAIGQRIEDVVLLRHQHSQAAVAVPREDALAEHKVVDIPQHTTLVDRQGAIRLIEGRCAPMFDDKDAPMGVVLVMRDIGERARLEKEILRASKLESVGILAGGIAHDFNNILTVVLGNLTLAQLDTTTGGKTARWLAEAERGTLRARDLTQQLLTFAKGGDPVRSAVRLPEVVRDSAAFALHGSKVSCEVDATPDLWPADIDKGQIGQVIQNLVINAVQAMPEGGKISARLKNHKGTVGPNGVARGDQPHNDRFICISISDTGTGIPPENLGRIFDPYFSTKKNGSGLGLATVYSIIRKHQGHIEVESEMGRGTTFQFWLPAATSAPVAVTTGNALPDRLSGRVLFMDDEETIRRMAEALLARLGFEVVTVSDGAAAVSTYAEAMASGQPFRVVVMDLTVPGGMGGRQAMEELLKIDAGVKAIVSSGYSSDPVLANHRAHGFCGVVAKPYRIADLARVMKTVLEQEKVA